MDLIASALIGGGIGVFIAELVRLYQRPRVELLELESTQPERGLAGGVQYLRRIKFRVKGSAPGTAASIALRWGDGPRQATYAKWDETPEPIELDGYAHHRGREAFEGDRRRDQRLALAGYRVLRFTDRRMRGDPGGIAAMVRAMLGA